MSKEKTDLRTPDSARESARERLAPLAPGFGKRVEAAVETFPSIPQAATAIGLSHNQVRRIIAEETVPSFPAIAMLARKSGYRFEWLAFDEMPQLNDERPTPAIAPSLMNDKFVWIPEVDARAAAGHSMINSDEVEVLSVFPVPLSMLDAAGVKPERVCMVRAKGNSMEPDIRDGDSMIVVMGEQALRDGDIYVLNVGDDTVVKQLQIEPDGGVTLISKNPAFAPRKIAKIDRSNMSIAGRVLAALKRFA